MTRRFATMSISVALAVGALAAGSGGVASATALARVTVSPATVSGEHSSTVSLSGAGFQSIPNGFGGIYVLFGTVTGTWRPSQGGINGTNFNYVPDSQTADNAGYQKFVAYPGGVTSADANGGLIAAGGSWQTTLTIPGPTFTAASGVAVNCRVVPCGVITIGAHGVVNGQNESFTPVSFSAPAVAAPPAVTTPAVRSSAARPTATARTTAAAATTAAPVTTAEPARSTVSDPSSSAVESAGGLVIGGPAGSRPATPSLTAVAATAKDGSSPSWWLALPVAAAVLAAAGGGFAWYRRRAARA